MNTGQIIKSTSTERFTTLPNELIKSKSLTLEEKGLLSYLLSLPSDWVVYKVNLYNNLPDKKGTIDKSFKGLQSKGYIVSDKVHDQKTGRFIGWNHTVYDTDMRENRVRETPSSGNTEFGKSAPILNTNVLQKTNVIQKTNSIQKPTLNEVENFFLEKGSTVEKGKQAFEYYEVANWHDSKGKPVKNWRQKMLAVWINNNSFNKPQKNKLEIYADSFNRVAAILDCEKDNQINGSRPETNFIGIK